jgi:hypothetical protein
LDVVDMMRAVNLVVEVFIDEDDDGTIYADALMLRNHDKRVLAQGFACLPPSSRGTARIRDEQIAALALTDLACSVGRDAATDGGGGRPTLQLQPDGATLLFSGCRPFDGRPPSDSPPDASPG